jgi:hypothetical protein
MTLSPFGSTRTMSNEGTIGVGAAGGGVGSCDGMPAECCRAVPGGETVGVIALDSDVGEVMPASRPSPPGVRGASTMPNQLIRKISPTATRIAMVIRPCALWTNSLRPWIILTSHHNMTLKSFHLEGVTVVKG